MANQRTSTDTMVKPVSARLAKHLGRMAEDAALKFPGGTEVLERAKGNPEFVNSLHKLFNHLGALKALILELLSTVLLPAVPHFIAREKFRHGETTDGVKVWVWDNFRTHFLDKVERDIPEATHRIHRLRKRSTDGPIIDELGGESVVETTLAHLWEMLKRQANGQQGDLLVNGYANIFYIRDSNDTLWAVYCYWYAGLREWCVSARSLTHPYEWDDGYQVLSR